MATFNQQHQKVGYQVNGDSVVVNGAAGAAGMTPTIEELPAQVSAADADGRPADLVVSLLRQAREAAADGDRGRVALLLQRAGQAAVPFAAISASIAAAVQSLS